MLMKSRKLRKNKIQKTKNEKKKSLVKKKLQNRMKKIKGGNDGAFFNNSQEMTKYLSKQDKIKYFEYMIKSNLNDEKNFSGLRPSQSYQKELERIQGSEDDDLKIKKSSMAMWLSYINDVFKCIFEEKKLHLLFEGFSEDKWSLRSYFNKKDMKNELDYIEEIKELFNYFFTSENKSMASRDILKNFTLKRVNPSAKHYSFYQNKILFDQDKIKEELKTIQKENPMEENKNTFDEINIKRVMSFRKQRYIDMEMTSFELFWYKCYTMNDGTKMNFAGIDNILEDVSKANKPKVESDTIQMEKKLRSSRDSISHSEEQQEEIRERNLETFSEKYTVPKSVLNSFEDESLVNDV